MGSVFKFKRFEVDQRGCAMKINTDGVLLAALATAEQPRSILDIGTGTGVLALILAQRYEQAMVEAVEIDAQAAATAGSNFQRSVFSKQLQVHHADIATYQTGQRYDLIVSNPPFFINDLKSAEIKKGIARHTDLHFFDALIDRVANLLSPVGQFWFILPVKQAELLVEKAQLYDLHAAQQIHLHSDAGKAEFRRIICLARGMQDMQVRHFNIYEREKVYTEEYRNLLKDFFLAY